MGKDNEPSKGFDVFADFLVGDKFAMNKPKDVDNDKFQDIDPDDLEKKLKTDKVDNSKKDDKDTKKDIKTDKANVEDVSKTSGDTKKDDSIGSDKSDDDKSKDIKKDSVEPEEPDEYESEISSFFANQLVKKLGIEETEKLKVDKIDDVLDLMKTIIDDNSAPTYASEEVETYDEFVRNGGSLRDFYKEVYAGKLNVDSVDAENEQDQMTIVRENLLNQGYKEDKIKKMVARYKENETLKEEAEDALDLIKDFNQRKVDSLLVEQKNQAESAKKAQQKFYNDVNSTIKTMTNVRGIPLNDKDKRETLRYAFDPEDDGLTKFQKDSRDVRNILELAFLLMNKDKKIDNADSKKENTDAYKTLRDKLKAKGSKVDDNQKGKEKDSGGSSLGDFGKGIIY